MGASDPGSPLLAYPYLTPPCLTPPYVTPPDPSPPAPDFSVNQIRPRSASEVSYEKRGLGRGCSNDLQTWSTQPWYGSFNYFLEHSKIICLGVPSEKIPETKTTSNSLGSNEDEKSATAVTFDSSRHPPP